MVDMNALRAKIKDSGIPITVIARKTGIIRETIYNRFRGAGEFRASEIEALSKVLHLSRQEVDDIFFTEKRE